MCACVCVLYTCPLRIADRRSIELRIDGAQLRCNQRGVVGMFIFT